LDKVQQEVQDLINENNEGNRQFSRDLVKKMLKCEHKHQDLNQRED